MLEAEAATISSSKDWFDLRLQYFRCLRIFIIPPPVLPFFSKFVIHPFSCKDIHVVSAKLLIETLVQVDSLKQQLDVGNNYPRSVLNG